MTLGHTRRCGYCRSGKEVYGQDDLSLKGFCADAFYELYPCLLALLYDAKFQQKRPLVINCPHTALPTFIHLSFKYKWLRIPLNLLEKFFRFIGSPKDAIDKDIVIEVLNENRRCAMPEGSRFVLRIPDIRQLCPASFFSVYPSLPFYKQGFSFACPDPKSNISYRVESLGSSEGRAAGRLFCGVSVTGYRITSVDSTSCPQALKRKKEMILENLLPRGLCPTLFNVALPYIITFSQGGYFKWRKDIHTVEVQCPDPEGRVSFEVRRNPSGAKDMTLTIKGTQGRCPRGHEERQTFALDAQRLICPYLFTRLFPHLFSRRAAGEEILLSCPFVQEAKYLLLKANVP